MGMLPVKVDLLQKLKPPNAPDCLNNVALNLQVYTYLYSDQQIQANQIFGTQKRNYTR